MRKPLQLPPTPSPAPALKLPRILSDTCIQAHAHTNTTHKDTELLTVATQALSDSHPALRIPELVVTAGTLHLVPAPHPPLGLCGARGQLALEAGSGETAFVSRLSLAPALIRG